MGFFDGVHQGHRKILTHLQNIAKKTGGETTVLTFWPHPRKILYPHNNLELLNSLNEKKELIDQTGIGHMIILPFSKSFAELDAQEFVVSQLVKKYNIAHLVVGFNHRFGKNKQGNYSALATLGEKYNFTTEQIDPLIIDETTVSSTLIRGLITRGEISLANKYLGYNYFIGGKVIHGKKLGHTIDFPTANILPDTNDKLLPRDGVYAVEAFHENKKYAGMLNIGRSPTFKDKNPEHAIEVHILNFEGSLYNKTLRVAFIERIRDEIKFENIKQLQAQLRKDKQLVRQIIHL